MWTPFKKKEPKIEKPPEKILSPREQLERSQRESHPAYYARKKEIRGMINSRRGPYG